MKLLAIFFIGTAFAETEDIDKVSEPTYSVCKDICLSEAHGGPGCVEGAINGAEFVESEQIWSRIRGTGAKMEPNSWNRSKNGAEFLESRYENTKKVKY